MDDKWFWSTLKYSNGNCADFHGYTDTFEGMELPGCGYPQMVTDEDFIECHYFISSDIVYASHIAIKLIFDAWNI